MAGVVGGLARLDPRRFRFHDLPADHAADIAGVQRAADRGDRGLHVDIVDEAGRRHRLRLARRSDRSKDPADDLDRLVLALQFHCQLFPDILVSVSVSRLARHWHGSGMALRCGAGDGAVADPLARLYGGCAASLMGPRRVAVERGLWLAL